MHLSVFPVVTGASEVINKTTFLAGSNLRTATLFPQQKNSMGEKISFFSIIFDYVPANWNITYIYSIFLFSFLVDGDVLLDEVAFLRLD